MRARQRNRASKIELRHWSSSSLKSSFNEDPNNLQWLLHQEGLSDIQREYFLTPRDTSASREYTGKTWLHRLRDEGMLKR